MEYVDAEILDVWRRGKVEALCNKGITLASEVIWRHLLARCRSMAATGTSGIGGDGGRKGGSLGLTLGRSPLLVEDLTVF
ncbi:hypothetical protein DPMN_055435 [Dreissena polymorpha]|uniref:Uncharacterized protein n=1 Tax=Dreissena polymorpha TaxID=45954 RepID=A0A9D4CRM8_DREPO|nr:hypothetical protein DPMN_055435 [Dreissena polymorpha]